MLGFWLIVVVFYVSTWQTFVCVVDLCGCCREPRWMCVIIAQTIVEQSTFVRLPQHDSRVVCCFESIHTHTHTREFVYTLGMLVLCTNTTRHSDGRRTHNARVASNNAYTVVYILSHFFD